MSTARLPHEPPSPSMSALSGALVRPAPAVGRGAACSTATAPPHSNRFARYRVQRRVVSARAEASVYDQIQALEVDLSRFPVSAPFEMEWLLWILASESVSAGIISRAVPPGSLMRSQMTSRYLRPLPPGRADRLGVTREAGPSCRLAGLRILQDRCVDPSLAPGVGRQDPLVSFRRVRVARDEPLPGGAAAPR